MTAAVWQAEAQRLDAVLPQLNLARTRSHARALITAGSVTVNSKTAHKSGLKVQPGDAITVTGETHYVSRAAHKLLAALDSFQVPVAGRLALDLGASTGGFTQVLLERDARRVIAVDVGHDQLAPQLRTDPRVCVAEGCNVRYLTAAELLRITGSAEKPQLVVGDLSFISLTLVLPAVAAVCEPGTQFVLLIKPQFELDRESVRGGIVVTPQLRTVALQRVISAARELGLRVTEIMPSPVRGTHGNLEFLVLFEFGSQPHPADLEMKLMTIAQTGEVADEC